jgi:hypothetical protein
MRTARAVVLAVVLVGLAPDLAAAAPPDHVTMYSDGDWVGGGQQRF